MSYLLLTPDQTGIPVSVTGEVNKASYIYRTCAEKSERISHHTPLKTTLPSGGMQLKMATLHVAARACSCILVCISNFFSKGHPQNTGINKVVWCSLLHAKNSVHIVCPQGNMIIPPID